MKIKDLKYYKPLDITELSGSPWNNAEKVLGLDENDKVIMAEPEDVVTPEDVADAINQAMEAETARTEDAYAKKDEIPDMEDYYTKEEVDEAISGITVDLSDYYTKDETDQAISAATQDLASTDYVDDAIAAIPEPDLSDYYTKDETDGAISTALVPYATKGWVSSQSYANQNYVMFKVNEAMQIETARTESTYAKPSDIPSLDGYATEEYVDDAIAAIPGVDLSGYAKTTAVTQDIQTAMASETARTESTYAKPSQIPSLDGYATEDWVEEQGYLTEHQDLSAYAKTTAVTEDIQTAMAAETARTESTYLKEHQSLDNYYTKSQVDAEITGATEGLASEQYVDDAIAAIPAVDLSPYAKTTAVTQDIQTAMAAETARTESTYLKEHQSLDNYYTKSEVDADFVSAATSVGQAIDAAVQGLASETYVNNAVAGLASEDYVDNAVTSATEGLASEEYVDNAVAGIVFPEDYATTGDVASAVEGLASESYVNDAISTATQGMATQDDLDGLASQEYVDNAVTDLAQAIGALGMVNDVSANGGTVTVRKTGMENGQIVTGSTSFNIVRPEDLDAAMDAASAWTDATYAKKTDIPSLAGYASEAYVDNAIATETARTESTYLKEHQSLADYYTKSEVDAEITGATADLATKTELRSGLQDKADRADVLDIKLEVDDFIENETARTEETYAKKSEIPSLTGYATQAWVEGKGYITGVTVDDELSSSSTNPVENKVIYETLNGVTSTTQLEMTSASTNTVEFSNGVPALYLYDTNHPDYQVAFLGDAQVELGVDTIYIRRLVVNGRRKYPSNGTQFIDSVNKLGKKIYYEGTNGQILFISSNLDGTFDYYLVYNKVDNYVVFYKTLPTIVDVTDHTARISDIPTAQDDSDFNKFVYFNTSDTEYGNVVSKIYGGPNQVIGENKTDSHPAVSINTQYWGRIYNNVSSNTPLPYGNEVIGGAKTVRDSVIIDKAEQALSGLTETVTLTLGSASTDTIRLNWDTVQLLETDTPRYLVAELRPNTFNYVETLSIGGINYIVINRNYGTSTGFDQRGTYQLAVKGNDSPSMTIDCSNHQTQNYLIIDKELLTLTIAENLTITRAKNIQQMIDNIPHPDMSDYWTSAQTQSAITAATQNLVTSGDVATQIGTAIENETARTESTYAKPSQIPSLNGYATEQWVQNQGYLTQHQSLAEYYTKTEIDGMIGDIESLLASI